jgi:DNA-directed RNA polymerase specialized sigma24 family protein
VADIAQVLRLSESTVKRRWSAARIWLLEALTHDGG